MKSDKEIEQCRKIEEKILKGELGEIHLIRTVSTYLLITLRNTPVKELTEIQKSGVATIWICKGRQKKNWIPFDENIHMRVETIPKVVATRNCDGKECKYWTFRCYGKEMKE